MNKLFAEMDISDFEKGRKQGALERNKLADLFSLFWMNPPFSKADEMFKHFFEIVSKGVAIYRCDNLETKIWQDLILKKADWIFIPRGRIRYEHNKRESKGARFPSAFIGVGVKPPINFNGKVLFLRGKNTA